MSDNNTTSINEKAVILFEMLDIDSSKTLEKREILKAMRDNKKVKTIIETSKSLEPLLHPAKYKSIFSKINTSSDGHITLEEFSKFIDDVEQVAKKEEKEQDAGNKESNNDNIPFIANAKKYCGININSNNNNNNTKTNKKIVHFVRHGEGFHNALARKIGRKAYLDPAVFDPELTNVGIQQAKDLQDEVLNLYLNVS